MALVVVSGIFGGCGLFPEPALKCEPSTHSSSSAHLECSHETEEAAVSFRAALHHLLAFQPPEYGSDYRGQVVGVDGQRITMELLGERRPLHWPRPLPFTIEPGEDVVIEQSGTSTKLLFASGALAYHADEAFRPMAEEQWLRSIEMRAERGCTSSLGTTVDLVLASERIPTGGSAEVDGWHIRNLGGFLDAGGCGSPEGRFQGAWIAETTEERFECFFPSWEVEACGSGILAANQRGSAHDFGTWDSYFPVAGRYRILSKDSEVIRFLIEEKDFVQKLRWPGPLPIDVSDGDIFELQKQGSWNVLTFPRGQIALASERAIWEIGSRSLDGAASMFLVPHCTMGKDPDLFGRGTVVLRLQFQTDTEEIVLLPGEQKHVGDWTYRLLHGARFQGATCTIGQTEGILEAGESGALVAYRHLDPTDE